MAVGGGFLSHLEDLFAPLGDVSLRRMFGGVGVFRDGLMFALVADDTLYMKGDAETAVRYETEGCPQFVYESKGKPTAMSYWRLPDRLCDEPEAFSEWAMAAFDAARRSQTQPKRRKRG